MVENYELRSLKDYEFYTHHPQYAALKAMGANPLIIEMINKMEAPDAFAEMKNAGNSHDLAASAHVFAISSDGADAAAGTGMQTVTVFGVLATGGYGTDVLILTGAVQVEGAVNFTRVITAWGSRFGTGLVAAGNITISNTGQAADYLYIPLGENRTDRMTFWVAPGYKAFVMDLESEFYQAPAAAALDIDGGAEVVIITSGSDGVVDQIEDVPAHLVAPYGPTNHKPPKKIISGHLLSKIQAQHASVNTGANVITSTRMVICCFNATTAEGGII